MKLNIISIRKSINKAFLKVKPNRTQIENFKKNILNLYDQINESESEEFHKNIISTFLKETYYSPDHYVNTKGRTDLVIHNGKDSSSTVGVLVETKKPSNKSEMSTKDNLNAKALQELILYYLRERITEKNIEVKHLIITNIYEWFIFNANDFDRLFAQNKKLVKQFTDFEEERLADTKTNFFYKQIAEPFLNQLDAEISFTYLDISDYEKIIRNNDKLDDNKLVALFKFFSPENLLKLPFANDSNSLDKGFYAELLHIIGLQETKEGSKKLIGRKTKKDRDAGSLLENTITILNYEDCLSQIKATDYGTNIEEQLYNVALELVITWLNRILFLKLLEGQLVKYHSGDKSFKFLSFERIPDFDALNKLFFQVLAIKENERNELVKQKFSKIPYLNSSLFEPNDLEHKTVRISNLEDEYMLPILNSTVLKDKTGKHRNGELNSLEYLLAFLDAYDFASEGAEEIQEENKTLINASVLGLIFEKINGYKDGSFFTPGFITMYMCRETIRRAVVQKFNETKNWNCKTIDNVYDKIEDKKEANSIINSLKICDPAVGSGHFLVSALNEIITIKSDLKILLDKGGKTLRDYHVEVVNDELVITDDEAQLFEYKPKSKESQRIQETLFHEKQTLIENCLFGVDINPNSVKICRLRLWIELLKNTYYKNGTENLETLPNIDINIKCGNSLINQYALDTDIKKALKKSKWTIDSYRLAVMTYQNTQSKEEKHSMEKLINEIKNDFESEIAANDKRLLKLNKLKGELFAHTNQQQLFDQTKTEKTKWSDKVKKYTNDIQKLETELEEIRTNKIYENAFEWRFEFPEVLNDDGDFVGFDVVIGNPPYFSISSEPSLSLVSEKYKAFNPSGDIYSLFIELSESILRKLGLSTLIVSNKWIRTNYGKTLRKYFVEETNPIMLVDFGQNLLFENAIVHTNIISFQRQVNLKQLSAVRFPDGYFNIIADNFKNYIEENTITNLEVSEDIWNVVSSEISSIRIKAEAIGKPLGNWDIKFFRGVLTGYNEAFIIDESSFQELIEKDKRNLDIIKPILRGRDTRRYFCNFAKLYLIGTFPSKNIVIKEYPSLEEYLNKFLPKLNQTGETFINDLGEKEKTRKKTQNKWFETQDSIAYYKEFDKSKIVFSEIVSEPQFHLDDKGYYPEATVFFITGNNLKYLTALLNSKFVTYLFKTYYMGGELVGKIRYKKAFLEKVPLAVPSIENENILNELVDEIINIKKDDSNNDTSEIETKIDSIVYKLYDLSEEEIKIVEESVK